MKKNKTLLILVLFFVVSIKGMAQFVTPPPPQPPPPPGLPVDNGVVVLLVLGVIYGVYKLIYSKKALKA